MKMVKRYLRTIDEHNENYYRLDTLDKTKPAVNQRPTPPKVTSETLLGRARALVITHNGRDYCLRVTQNGKLILTA